MSTAEWVKLVSIPFFTGAVGWLINWTGLIMLFNPVEFRGLRIPGLSDLSTLLPRKLQEVPGIMQGGIGWQGIVPARAAKMGSISVDKAISKLGTPAEFFEQLEPDKMAAHIVSLFEPEIPEMVDRTMRREHPGLWQDVPARAKQAVYGRVQAQLPEIVRDVTNEIGTLPVLGVFVGWTTNLLGMWVIFEPVDERKIGPLKLHALFVRRQSEVAEVYAQIIADDVVTLENIGNFLLDGPRGDRTRQMLEEAMAPAIDRAAGPARAAVRVAVGTREYDNIRESVASQAADQTLTGFRDPEFSRQQSEKMRVLIAERTKELASRDFVEMLRSAFKEDEWMLYLHGAVMGLAGGFIHLALFG